jgi:hypothetical protein
MIYLYIVSDWKFTALGNISFILYHKASGILGVYYGMSVVWDCLTMTFKKQKKLNVDPIV